MARGAPVPIGSETVAQNNYTYVKTENGWRLKHHIIAEEKLGRPIDTKAERITFKDSNRTNLDPDNVIVKPKYENNDQRKKRANQIVDKIAELQSELEALENGE